MLNKIVNINPNTGYKESKGNSFSSMKNLLKENETPGSGDKIELSPALKFLKKLEWNLKDVKVLEDKYYVSFSSSGIEFYTCVDFSKLDINPYLDYKIRSSAPSYADPAISSPEMEIEISLSAAFQKKQRGFLGIIGKESSQENFSEPELKDLLKKLNQIFEKLFVIYSENARYQSHKINILVEDSLEHLSGFPIINDLLILFLEKLTEIKISARITSLNNDEPPVIIDSVSLKNQE